MYVLNIVTYIFNTDTNIECRCHTFLESIYSANKIKNYTLFNIKIYTI